MNPSPNISPIRLGRDQPARAVAAARRSSDACGTCRCSPADEAQALAERTSIRFVYEQAPRGLHLRPRRTRRSRATARRSPSRWTCRAFPTERKDQLIRDSRTALDDDAGRGPRDRRGRRASVRTRRVRSHSTWTKEVVIYLQRAPRAVPGRRRISRSRCASTRWVRSRPTSSDTSVRSARSELRGREERARRGRRSRERRPASTGRRPRRQGRRRAGLRGLAGRASAASDGSPSTSAVNRVEESRGEPPATRLGRDPHDRLPPCSTRPRKRSRRGDRARARPHRSRLRARSSRRRRAPSSRSIRAAARCSRSRPTRTSTRTCSSVRRHGVSSPSSTHPTRTCRS